jgi:two-component system KDP operon response regulator KdpE
MKILMIEDDKATVEVIRLTLECQDPTSVITSKEKGQDGLETARTEQFDVVVLDLGLPDIDGLRVLKELRDFSQTPVLVVSARHDPAVITNALDLGAQDYILKPFKFQSLLSSLQDVTAKSKSDEVQHSCWRMTDDFTLCSKPQEAFLKNKRIELSREEWIVLNKLVEHCGRIVPSKTLAESLSGARYVSDTIVDMVINQLRKKLGDDPYIPKIIISEYGCGYRFIRSNRSPDLTHDGLPDLKITG